MADEGMNTSSAAGVGTGGATAAAPVAAPAPAPSAPAAAPAPTPAAPGTDQPAPPVKPGEPNLGEGPTPEFLDFLDNIGLDEPATPAQKIESPSPDALSKDNASDEIKTTDAGDTRSEVDKPTEPSGDDAPTKPAAETDEPIDLLADDADWSQPSKADLAYIEKHVPKAHLSPVRKLARDAKMARTFLNPNCPTDVFVDNLEKKSKMRFGAVESEILKRNIESDPISFLGKAFAATADDQGNSEPYQRLLDATITTNVDYVTDLLRSQGFDVTKGDGTGTSAKPGLNGKGDLTNYTDEEIDGIRESAAFQQFAETFPEDAEKLGSILDHTKQLRHDKATEGERQQTETEEQTKARQAAETQTAKYTSDFSKTYEENVTSFVNNKLDKDYGLEVTPEEKEKSPMMALLKSAKKRLIEMGGLDGSGDFDNDLYAWGKDRPAFKEAAKAMVEFTRAGETENAAASAKEIQQFADLFMAERLKTVPELALIDEMMQMVAKNQKQALDVREELGAPDTPLVRNTPGGPPQTFLDEIDSL